MALEDQAPSTDRFEAIVRAETGPLFGVAYSILRDVQEAEDAVQETMEVAWRRWDSLRDPQKRGAWLRQICVRRYPPEPAASLLAGRPLRKRGQHPD